MSHVVAGIVLGWVLTAGAGPTAEMAQGAVAQDSDHDGLSDALEAELLRQFLPRWMVGKDDCSVRPARFAAGVTHPTVVEENGTVYGQAFPVQLHGDEVELHFYQLWRRDCGQRGHPLDAEHVAVLLRRDDIVGSEPKWKALYWYAAAHEDTVCDASQMTRASTLKAEDKGATVWVSPGKHASFLSEELCSHGCGGDRCVDMEWMKTAEVVNVGELSRLMNGAAWVSFAGWSLAEKMGRSDFGEARVERLERLPETDVAWANPSKRPAQAAIYGGSSALNGVELGGRNTDTALVLANGKTNEALDSAQKKTGNALTKSYRNVVKALGGAAKSTGKALGVEKNEDGAPR
jgi:hypothetical protein